MWIFLFLASVQMGRVYAQEAKTVYKIVRTKDSVAVSPATTEFGLTLGTVSRTVDLNGDGVKDLIVSFGNCGNWGDCIFGFFVAKDTGKYTCVFEEYLPPFEIAPSATRVQGRLWKDIVLWERSDNGETPKSIKKKMVFDGIVYKMK